MNIREDEEKNEDWQGSMKIGKIKNVSPPCQHYSI